MICPKAYSKFNDLGVLSKSDDVLTITRTTIKSFFFLFWGGFNVRLTREALQMWRFKLIL